VRYVLATLGTALVVFLTATAAFGTSGLRYCERPGGPGNFLAASPSVSCRTARKVEARVFSSACDEHNRCDAYGFDCLAVWEGRYDRPFSYTHHAVCHSGRRRIVLDAG
jgi:hypothetical protein